MTTKLAISLPDELAQQARRAVETGQAPSVSGYIAEALKRMAQEDELAALLEDLDQEYGPPSEEDHTWARQTLGLD